MLWTFTAQARIESHTTFCFQINDKHRLQITQLECLSQASCWEITSLDKWLDTCEDQGYANQGVAPLLYYAQLPYQ